MASKAIQELEKAIHAVRAAQAWADNPIHPHASNASHMDVVYEALFVRAYVAFEGFLEAFFLELVSGSHQSQRSTVKKVANFASEDAARTMIHQGRPYVDWMPYNDHTKKRAAFFFDKGGPFSELDDPRLRTLEETKTIRHAIVHASRSARISFDRLAPPRAGSPRPTPAQYLREVVIHGPPPTNRFQVFLAEFSEIASTLDK